MEIIKSTPPTLWPQPSSASNSLARLSSTLVLQLGPPVHRPTSLPCTVFSSCLFSPLCIHRLHFSSLQQLFKLYVLALTLLLSHTHDLLPLGDSSHLLCLHSWPGCWHSVKVKSILSYRSRPLCTHTHGPPQMPYCRPVTTGCFALQNSCLSSSDSSHSLLSSQTSTSTVLSCPAHKKQSSEALFIFYHETYKPACILALPSSLKSSHLALWLSHDFSPSLFPSLMVSSSPFFDSNFPSVFKHIYFFLIIKKENKSFFNLMSHSMDHPVPSSKSMETETTWLEGLEGAPCDLNMWCWLVGVGAEGGAWCLVSID